MRPFFSFIPLAILISACSSGTPGSVVADIGSISSGSAAVSDANARSAVAVDFLRALLGKDMETLKKYGDGPNEFFDHGALMSEINDFIYNSHLEYEFRSVTDILKGKKIHIEIIDQRDDGVFTVIYTTIANRDKIYSNFLYDQWMKEYFACEFIKCDKRYILRLNFCFAETDGPYHGDYG